ETGVAIGGTSGHIQSKRGRRTAPAKAMSPPSRAIGRCYLTTESATDATPENPNWWAAAGVTSMIRPCTNGPRSLIRATTERPLLRLVTRTIVPNGSDRWAAVRPEAEAVSPLAVWPPE